MNISIQKTSQDDRESRNDKKTPIKSVRLRGVDFQPPIPEPVYQPILQLILKLMT